MAKSFPRTYVHVFDEPKRKGIPERHVEHSTDLPAMNKKFDEAAEDYAHRIGAVVTTAEALAEYLEKPKAKKRKAPPKKTESEPQGQATVPEPTIPE